MLPPVFDVGYTSPALNCNPSRPVTTIDVNLPVLGVELPIMVLLSAVNVVAPPTVANSNPL